MSGGQTASALAYETAVRIVEDRIGIDGAIVIVVQRGGVFGCNWYAREDSKLNVESMTAIGAHAVGMLRALSLGQHFIDVDELARLRADSAELARLRETGLK